MNSPLLIAEAADDFASPGYSSGTELPPVPVDNTIEEIPFNSSVLNPDILYLAAAVIILIIALIVVFMLIKAVKKNTSMSSFAGFEEESITGEPDAEDEIPVIKDSSPSKKSQTSKLGTPSTLKASIKNFLERTQNI